MVVEVTLEDTPPKPDYVSESLFFPVYRHTGRTCEHRLQIPRLTSRRLARSRRRGGRVNGEGRAATTGACAAGGRV